MRKKRIQEHEGVESCHLLKRLQTDGDEKRSPVGPVVAQGLQLLHLTRLPPPIPFFRLSNFRLHLLDHLLHLPRRRLWAQHLDRPPGTGRLPPSEVIPRTFGQPKAKQKLQNGRHRAQAEHPAPSLRDREEDGVDEVGNDLTQGDQDDEGGDDATSEGVGGDLGEVDGKGHRGETDTDADEDATCGSCLVSKETTSQEEKEKRTEDNFSERLRRGLFKRSHRKQHSSVHDHGFPSTPIR